MAVGRPGQALAMGGDLMDVRRRWEELGRDFAVAEGRDRVAVSVSVLDCTPHQ